MVTRVLANNLWNIGKKLLESIQKHYREERQEVGDKLSFLGLKLLPEVSTLPSLVALSIVKLEQKTVQNTMWSYIGHLIKGSCDIKGGSLSQ